MARLFWVKASLAAAGTGAGLYGMLTESPTLVWVAIALVGVAFGLRFVKTGRGKGDESSG